MASRKNTPSKTQSPSKARKARDAAKAAPSIETARRWIKDVGLADHPERWSRVEDVTAITAEGLPARVVIRCDDPQTMANGRSVCVERREIAVQDLFQVRRCVPCQKRAVRRRRARSRSSKTTEQRIAELEARLAVLKAEADSDAA